MAGGLPQPAANKIPVKQVAIETYKLVWEHRRRIAYWAMAPFILCTLIWLGEDTLASSDLVKGSYLLESTFSLLSIVLGTLITVPYQVVIHRLAYPGFNFDSGSHGPRLNMIYKYYFIYSLILMDFPYLIYFYLNEPISNSIIKLLPILSFVYVSIAFILIFPATAIGVKSRLLRVWWMLQGNLFRIILSVFLTTAPVYLLSLVPIFLVDFSENSSFLSDAANAAMLSALTMVILGLWASCVSLCYYHVTGRQPLVNDTPTDAVDG